VTIEPLEVMLILLLHLQM